MSSLRKQRSLQRIERVLARREHEVALRLARANEALTQARDVERNVSVMAAEYRDAFHRALSQPDNVVGSATWQTFLESLARALDQQSRLVAAGEAQRAQVLAAWREVARERRGVVALIDLEVRRAAAVERRHDRRALAARRKM